MKLAVLLLAFSLSACAGLKVAQVTSSNARTVTVEVLAGDTKDALKLADAECGKYGRVARMAGKLPESGDLLFDCVN